MGKKRTLVFLEGLFHLALLEQLISNFSYVLCDLQCNFRIFGVLVLINGVIFVRIA